jgi:cysteine desulfurase
MNADEFTVQSSVRFGIGRFTTKEEIDFVVERTTEAVAKLRNMSPLWEMYNDGVDFKSIKWN